MFNLVYVNNVASVRWVFSRVRYSLTHFRFARRIWERLGFAKAGLIPRAGRLRRTDGPGEEYVDAWVFYKRFDDHDGQGDGSVS